MANMEADGALTRKRAVENRNEAHSLLQISPWADLFQLVVRKRLCDNGWVKMRTHLTPAIASLNYKNMSNSKQCGSIVQGQVGKGRKFFEFKEDAPARKELMRIVSDRLFTVGFIFFVICTHTHTHTHTRTQGVANASEVEYGRCGAIFNEDGKSCEAQYQHMDFKKGEGVCAVILAVGSGVCMHMHNTIMDMHQGDMLVISPNYVHGGGEYDPPEQGSNGNMRMHLYVHWRGFRKFDDTTTIHHPEVRIFVYM